MSSTHQKISPADWGRIHAKAWLDDKFRNLLESDPTAALHHFAAEHGLKWDQLLDINERPADVTDEALKDILSGKTVGSSAPPSCC